MVKIVGILYLVGDFTGVLSVVFSIASSSPAVGVLRLPLGLQEIALALWLIIKGFNSRMFPNSENKELNNQ